MTNSITKISITTDPLEGIALLMFLFVESQLQRLAWDPVQSLRLSSLHTITFTMSVFFISLSPLPPGIAGTLVCRQKNVPLDGAPLVVGVATILKQFSSTQPAPTSS